MEPNSHLSEDAQKVWNWFQAKLDESNEKDKRKHPDETEYERTQRRQAVIAQEKHDHAQRMLRQKQDEESKSQDSYAQYMETLVENIRQIERAKNLANRRDRAWLDMGKIRAAQGNQRAFWPPEVRDAWESRHGSDAIEGIGYGRPIGFTKWQQDELNRQKKELRRVSKEYQKYQNQFRLPPIPRSN